MYCVVEFTVWSALGLSLVFFNVAFFLTAFGVGPRLYDPQLPRIKSGEADVV